MGIYVVMLQYGEIKKQYSKEEIMILGYTCYKQTMIYICNKSVNRF